MLKPLKISLVVPIAIAIFSCAEPPTQEVATTQAALDGATRAEANVYAEQSFQAAKDTLDAALAAIAQQESKWFKNYEAATLSLKTARELAQKAASDAETNKAALRKEILAMLSKVETTLSEAQTSLASAPRGKGADEDIDRLGMLLNMVGSTLGEARNELNAGRLKAAREQAFSAENQIVQVQNDVAVALEKVEAWKQKRRRR